MASEIRKDYLQERYVLISPRRHRQAADIERPERLNPRNNTCAFCPSSIDSLRSLLTIGPKLKWHVKAIASRSPILSIDYQTAYGRQEIIIETPSHVQQMEDLSDEHIERVFEAYAHRHRDLASDAKIRYILISKQSGGRAQTSLEHSHSQISAGAFLSPDIIDRSQRAQAYAQDHGRCAYCDILDKEKHSERAVFENDDVIAFTPYASFQNFEVWIMPKRHIGQIPQLNQDERAGVASLLRQLARAISDLHLPYQYSIQQLTDSQEQHLYLRLVPRGTVWSGPELADGLTVNAVSPEEAATYYRQGLKK